MQSSVFSRYAGKTGGPSEFANSPETREVTVLLEIVNPAVRHILSVHLQWI